MFGASSYQIICPNLYIQAKLTKSNVAGWCDENMKVEDVEALAETVDYDTTARTLGVGDGHR